MCGFPLNQLLFLSQVLGAKLGEGCLLSIQWWEIVWFAKAIPRHAFFTWLALWGRLSTNERIVSWVISWDILCVICRGRACTENRDHIFFKCPFSQRSWRIIKKWCCKEGLDDEWGNLITWAVQNWKGKIFREDCCRLGFNAGIYHVFGLQEMLLSTRALWEQRNKFRGHKESEVQNRTQGCISQL